MATENASRRRTKSRTTSPDLARGAAPAAAADGEGPDPRLVAALEAARHEPGEAGRWDAVEELLGEVQQPEAVAALLLEVLDGPRGAELADALGQRAVRLHDEWFGDDPAPLIDLLGKLLALDPSLDWAFERLTLLLSVSQRWTELLALYDRTLSRLKDGPQRRKILQEAAGVAKDFLGEMGRAIGYLDELFSVRPADPHVASALERLLEREERWADLARVWGRRLDYVSGGEAHELRGRLARLRLERLDDVAGALADAQALLSGRGDDTVACELLERVVALPAAAASLRRQALELLRGHYEKQGKSDRIVALLQTAHSFASDEEKVVLLRESAERLQDQGEGSAAMEKLVELLRLNPDDAEIRTRLRHLAELSGRHDLYVEGLSLAAGATRSGKLRGALLIEAGRVEEDVRGNSAQAIVYFTRAAADPEAEPVRVLAALRRLVSLLDRDDQAEARLDVLERLAAASPERAEQRTVLGQAGRLAARIGQTDRAVAAWQARVALDAADREALDALVELLASAGRHGPLGEVLRQRVETASDLAEARADLQRLARLQAQALGDRAAAIATWLEIERRYSADPESTQALLELYATEGRWEDLAALLERTGDEDRRRLAALYCRLGELCRGELARPSDAVIAYGRALEIDPTGADALAGLHALLDAPGCEGAALAALVRAYTVTLQIERLAALAERRLRLAPDDAARARLLVETAELLERERGDRDAALAQLARALVLSPENARTEGEILRLAPLATDGFRVALEAVRGAIGRLPASSLRVVHLRLQEAALLEQHLSDPAAALEAYRQACEIAPDRQAAKVGRVRLAAALQRWSEAAEAVLSPPIAADVVTGELLPLVEKAAAASGAVAAAAEALSAELTRRKGVPRILARDIEATVATWYEAHGVDEGAALATTALLRASRFDRHHVPTLQRLAELQRQRGDRALADTLARLCELQPANLDPWLEALELAHGPLADRATTLKTGFGLIEHAAHLLRAELAASGKVAPVAALERALDVVVERLLASGDRADAARAVAALHGATALPLPGDTVRALRRRAARIALEVVGDRARARELYRAVIEDDGGDRDALATLARLYEEADLLSEVLTLRKRELALTQAPAERLALRLDMARVAGLIEERSPRITTLLANLHEAPGDAATIEVLKRILAAQGKERDLVEILAEQAGQLEQTGATGRAAELWTDVAILSERALGDTARALQAYERVAHLAPTPDALDALARLAAARGDHMTAAGWLEQRLQGALGGERTAIALRLGQAYLECGQRHRAIGCLERALGEDAAAADVRALLIETYRKAEAWEPLARVLAEGCLPGAPPETVAAYARESATLYQEKLSRPDLAVPVLERAAGLVPKDRWLRTHLAEGLRVAGRHGEARALLESLLEEMGRRRSKERAAIHHQLALVARAEGDWKVALEHLDQAAAIDMGSLRVLLDLGETAEAAGEWERAERAFQALLVLARRTDPDEAPSSVSETLLRLEKVARARGDAAAADEFFDSAGAAALQSGVEARRMQAALLARGEGERALALLDRRRQAAGGSAEEAEILCDRAELLERLGRLADAQEALALAIEKAPDLARAHALARGLAATAGEPARYLATVERVLSDMRRRDDGPRVCDLLLRAGQAAEADLGDLARAAAFYARAEETGARELDVLVAIGRVAARRGERDELARVLRQLQRMADHATSPDAEAEALFRQAELMLGSDPLRLQGLETLARALEKRADFARALELVRAAQVPEADLPRVMPLYERVARSSGDERMLLDFLERRAAGRDATQELVSEGVEVALALGEGARAEKLLERAVALAEAAGNPRAAAWALLDLAQRKKSAGQLDAAFAWLEAAAAASDSPRIPALLRELAREAARTPGGAALAARAFERLRERNPTERELWLPLMEMYARAGDGERLGRLVDDTVAKLVERTDRILVRLTWARFLLADPARQDEAATVLRDVLLEEPGHPEALGQLAELHERRGEIPEALALLSEALRDAEAAGDEARRAATTRKLGDLLGKADPAQAKAVYRQTLAGAISDAQLRRELQERLYALLDPEESEEKAALAERMLAEETGEVAARRALALADLRRELHDDEGERRALDLGLARAPRHPALFERLAAFFAERQEWEGWARLMEDEAARQADAAPAAAAALYRRIAATRRDRLKDAAGAVALLQRAAALEPGDLGQLRELIACLEELGDLRGAIDAVAGALGRPGLATGEQVALLRLRAALNLRRGQAWLVVGDLELALLQGGAADPALTDELIEALYAAAQDSARQDDLDGQRRATLRLAELYTQRGDSERAQRMLFDWVDDHPEDADALDALRARFEADGRWEDVVRVCQRLAGSVEGDRRVEAVLGLARALMNLGRAAEAIPVLEDLLGQHPGQPVVVDLLSSLYHAAGDSLKIAHLKVAQAALMQDEDAQFAALVEGADMLLQGGDAQLAVEAINRAFALRPDDRTVQRLLGDALLANGQFDQAATVLEQLIGDGRGLDPEELCALYHRLSRAAGGMGDGQEQVSCLRKAMEADRKNGLVAAELADLAEALGDDDLALKALRAITMNAPDGPMSKAVAFYRQARIAFKNGDRQRALIFAKRALQEDAGLTDAQQLLEQLR